MRIVFFGTPVFAATVLKELLLGPHQVVAVVTRPDQPQGRSLQMTPSPVKRYLNLIQSQIPVFTPEKASHPSFVEKLQSFSPDFFVVVGYGEILKQNLLDLPRIAPLNIHTSLLPAYRGAAPIQRAMMAGENEIGITIMRMNAEMDAGHLLLQLSMECPPTLRFDEVESKMMDLAVAGIKAVLSDFPRYAEKEIRQDLSRVSRAPKIQPEDCVIDCRQPIGVIQRQIMALSPKPGAYFYSQIQGEVKRVKLIDAEVIDGASAIEGLYEHEGRLIFGSSTGVLLINRLQIEGKNIVAAKEFLNGYRHLLPLVLIIK